VAQAEESALPNNPFPAEKGWRRVRDVEPLDIGDVMPNYSFTNELGKAVSLDELKGKPYAFTFIYTRCPIPDFCPLMSKQFMDVQRLLENTPDAPEGWRLFSITIDPEYDTVAVLKGYASRYKYDPARWSFLTGPLIDITAIAEQFGLMFYRPDETISHNLRTVVIDRAGKVQSIIMGNTWKAEDLVTSLVEAGKVNPTTE
jgi:protein SCO1/2